MLHTTGTISQSNYGGSVTAQKAAFHHSISALIVEIEGDTFWTREVHFDGEGAYDLDHYHTPQVTTKDPKAVAAIVYGDVHVRSLDKKIDQLIEQVRSAFRPEYEVYHDLHDHHIGSHHNEKDLIFNMNLAVNGELSIRDELMLSVEFMNCKGRGYIVDSNHNRHLNQWFSRYKPINDITNAELYFELGEMLNHDLLHGGDGNLFKLFMEKYCDAILYFVDADNTFKIRSIDCSQHGDRGPNGARGSIKSFAKTGNKMMVGHSHTPGIEKGAYQVGVMSPDLHYAMHGLSSWCNAHGIIYDNGKRALFHIVKNKLSPTMRVL